MRIAAPADRRFRRAHVSPGRKRSWRESWRRIARLAVALSVAGYGLYRGTDLVLSAEALTVTRITVSGNSRMARGEVLALLEGLRGASMVMADIEASRQRLLSAPWVSDAAIRRIFPGTVSVVISERQPMGIGRIGDSLFLIDQRGTIIDEFGPNYAELDLAIIDGLGGASATAGMLVDESRAALVGRLLSELQRRPDLAKRISQIDVADMRDAVVILKDDTVLVRLGDEHFVDRLQSYFDLMPALRERVPNIDSVDLRFDERVYVRPRESAAKGARVSKGKKS